MELLAGARSCCAPETLTEFVMVPVAVGVTTTLTVASKAEASDPKLHVTILFAWLQLPWDGVADTKLVPPGRLSARITPEASCGPSLSASMEYVRFNPMPTGSGDALA